MLLVPPSIAPTSSGKPVVQQSTTAVERVDANTLQASIKAHFLSSSPPCACSQIVTTGISCIPMTSTDVHLWSPSWMCIVPKLYACCLSLRTLPHALVISGFPCTTLRHLILFVFHPLFNALSAGFSLFHYFPIWLYL